MGDYQSRTGEPFGWRDVAVLCGWQPSTTTLKKQGGRDIRAGEIWLIARRLGGSPGWLMFGEGAMRWTPDTPGIETEEDDDPRSPVVEHPLPKQRRSVTAPAQRPAKRAGGRGGR